MRRTSVRRKPGRAAETAAVVVAVAALVVLGAAACGDGGTGPEPGVATGDIAVTVTSDGAALAGVTVRLFASGATTAMATRQTTSAGRASFADVAAGTYAVEIDVPEGLELDTGEVRRNVTVAGGGSAEVAFALVAGEDPQGGVVEIHLTAGSRFDPSSVTISVGTTVRWISDTSTFHTITPRDHSEWARVEMDAQGKTFEHTFNTTGTFNYFCEPHESAGMTGSITVQ